MTQTLYLLGDINFKGVDAGTPALQAIAPTIRDANLVFANLECCLYAPDESESERRGFYADPAHAGTLRAAGIQAVGLANNVNVGRAAVASALGVLHAEGIATVGAGLDAAAASAPLVLERDGVRYGILQRTAVYWPDGHVATERHPGVAVIDGFTAYRPRLDSQAARTRPGVPPEVLTWACPRSLSDYRRDVAALRAESDVVIASLHWGYRREVLDYQREYAHAAIDSGADVVFGHGPHMILPVESYRGKPVFYGAGNFSFKQAHGDDMHHEWVGSMLRITVEEARIASIEIEFVTRDAANRTIVLPLTAPAAATHAHDLINDSAALGAHWREHDGRLSLLLD